MSNLSNDQLGELKKEGLWNFAKGLSNSQKLASRVGYGLLFFALLDFISTLYPTNFTNAIWEFDFVGNVVERVAVPLIGFVLIFLVAPGNTSKGERLLMKLLSWSTIFVFLAYFPLIALGLSSAVRIDHQNNDRLESRINQSRVAITQLRDQVTQTQNSEQLSILLGSLEDNGQAPEINADEYETIKQEVVTNLSRQLNDLKTDETSTRKRQRNTLLKKTFRSTIGALLAAIVFLSIWKETAWARRRIK